MIFTKESSARMRTMMKLLQRGAGPAADVKPPKVKVPKAKAKPAKNPAKPPAGGVSEGGGDYGQYTKKESMDMQYDDQFQAWDAGFVQKCAEYGVDPNALLEWDAAVHAGDLQKEAQMFGNIMNSIGDSVGNIGTKVRQGVQSIGNNIQRGVAGAVDSGLGRVQQGVQGIQSGVQNAGRNLGATLNQGAGLVRDIGGAVGSQGQAMAGQARQGIQQAGQAVQRGAQQAGQAVQQGAQNAGRNLGATLNQGAGLAQDIGGAVGSQGRAAFGQGQRAFNGTGFAQGLRTGQGAGPYAQR